MLIKTFDVSKCKLDLLTRLRKYRWLQHQSPHRRRRHSGPPRSAAAPRLLVLFVVGASADVSEHPGNPSGSLSLSLRSVSSPSLCCCHARSGSCLPCLLAAAVTHTHTHARLLLFLPLHLQLNVSSPYCSRGVGEGSLNQTEDRLPSGRGSNCGFIADQGESIRHSCTRGRMI